jgi:uncharacterized protein (TIGR02145 family)
MKKIYILKSILVIIFTLILTTDCTKEDLKSLPSITTTAVSNITITTAITGGTISTDGGAEITARGVCWSTTQNPSLLHDNTADGKGTGTFTSSLTGLIGNTTYYVRAYATNAAGTEYGAQVSFKTSPAQPVLTTASVTSIGQNAAKSGGTITSDGGGTISAQGVCWSTSTGPTVDLTTKTVDDLTSTTFISSITGLSAGTKYYIRAYATNSSGTGYGNELNFTTSSAIAPTVTTTAATSITGTTATAGGNVTSDGGTAVTARGIVWGTSENPTVDLTTKTTETGTTGTFTSSITGLTIGTKYYVRAYAINSVGTTYGTQVSFTTLNVPTVTTTVATIITLVSAKSGGNVTSDGGSAITARGVVWSTNAGPTVSLTTKTSETGSTGTFSSSLTGLNSNTTYFLRAYATNIAGTSYGTEVSFKTQTEGTIADIESNVYKTITIGTQTWFAENLKATKFNDGSLIQNITDQSAWWNGITTPAYCWYNNDISYKNVHGALYTWYVVDPVGNGGKNVCPTGWHPATDAEWTVLAQYLVNNGFGYGGSGDDIGKSLASISGWNVSSTEACPGNDQSSNNLTGFNAKPSGGRDVNGSSSLGYAGLWWCAPGDDIGSAWYRAVGADFSYLRRGIFLKGSGNSVRCIKDN